MPTPTWVACKDITTSDAIQKEHPMNLENKPFDEVSELYKVIPLKPFRHTPGVQFDIVPMDLLPHISGIDRVIHQGKAVSPGPVGDVKTPWYMHPYQEDYLIVMHGVRRTDIYTPKHGKIEHFEVAPDYIKKNDELLLQGAAMLVWPCNVFHRIVSCDQGSASLNFAVRHEGFDIKNNFSIYDLDPDKGSSRVIRAGHLDQENITLD